MVVFIVYCYPRPNLGRVILVVIVFFFIIFLSLENKGKTYTSIHSEDLRIRRIQIFLYSSPVPTFTEV